jgi:hypothetical protein
MRETVKAKGSRMKSATAIAALLFAQLAFVAHGTDLSALCADRAALERVYHDHRLGTKQPFEQAMPRELLDRLVEQDRHKEAVLRKVYAVKITPELLAAEVQRIEATTRAPEVLAEIKHALGDDPERFARTMAGPILIERELRRRFDNDDRLHAAQRREAEQARESLLARKHVAGMCAVTWQLTPRPEDGKSEISAPPAQTKGAATSGTYSVEATAQIAQVLTPPTSERDRKTYFEDLDPELQKVLRVQLQKPGDVSAVIETPGGFLVFVAKEKTAKTLSAASLSIPKRSYEEWLAQQPE